MNILVVNGPNLNFLGTREPGLYGSSTLEEINSQILSFAGSYRKDISVDFFQSNSEGEIVDRIHGAFGKYDGIVINPAAYTHTSIAIRDAITAVNLPVVEVHISNIYKREEFRHMSYVSDVSLGVVSGFGVNSYILGFKGLVDHLSADSAQDEK